jgi:aldose 1-epimerase
MTTITESPDSSQDGEITLANANLNLFVSPWGASLRGLVADGKDEIVTRYAGADNKVGGEGDVLIPFPGRIKAGIYSFQGTEYHLNKNDSEGPNAIHGFLRKREWTVVEQSGQTVTFAVDFAADEAPGYPFPLHTEVSYELEPSGFVVRYEITNTGSIDAPVAAGFHPYFSLGTALIDDCMLTVPFQSTLVYDSMIPTGEVAPITELQYDFTRERLIGSTKFNTCYLDPIRDENGNVVITLRTSDAYKSLSVVLGPEINYVVLYSGDVLPDTHRRKALAIEPMSCGSDAFNHREWGLATVKPGESLNGKWSVTYKTT